MASWPSPENTTGRSTVISGGSEIVNKNKKIKLNVNNTTTTKTNYNNNWLKKKKKKILAQMAKGP